MPTIAIRTYVIRNIGIADLMINSEYGTIGMFIGIPLTCIREIQGKLVALSGDIHLYSGARFTTKKQSVPRVYHVQFVFQVSTSNKYWLVGFGRVKQWELVNQIVKCQI